MSDKTRLSLSRIRENFVARLRGVPARGGAVTLTDIVHITDADRNRAAKLDRTHGRLVVAAGGFAILFGAVSAGLVARTVIFPMAPTHAQMTSNVPPPDAKIGDDIGDDGKGTTQHRPRASILDRNGEVLAISLPMAALYANPVEMMDPVDAAHRLKSVLPRIDENEILERLQQSDRKFVYIDRRLTPSEERAVNNLGIPGLYFEAATKRRYPLGRVAAQVLGGVDVDGHGVAGVERAFDKVLERGTDPVKLSIDIHVQSVLHEELEKSKEEFQAIGACGIVMDVHTGEVIAMVSLPDYDANDFGNAAPDERFNRAVTGMFEPGSTFKLQTAAMALDFGTAHIWDQFDAANNIRIGRFTITDYKGKHRFLYLPEVIAYSSNLGAAHIGLGVGPQRQRAWLAAMGMFRRIGIELPEAGQPLVPSAANWKEATTMTVAFGHGIAVSPLHVVRGTAALANGGYVITPTILARDDIDNSADVQPVGPRVMNPNTSDVVRKLMRIVVTDGYGKPADIPGYFVGGKTGTAEKVGANGTYKKHANVSAFMSVFPMNAPRYAVYFMLDEPQGNKETGGYATAGAVSAPGAGRVIARIAPILGLFPDTANMDVIQASLSIPLQPAPGSGESTGTGAPLTASLPPMLPPSMPLKGKSSLRHEAALKIVAAEGRAVASR
jgi:cell division protein FtsI (penicillin-binding protein 3)